MSDEVLPKDKLLFQLRGPHINSFNIVKAFQAVIQEPYMEIPYDAGREICRLQGLCFAAADEIERLQEAKRAALQLANIRAKEANELRALLAKAYAIKISEQGATDNSDATSIKWDISR